MGVDYEAFKLGAASQIPLRRVGQPEDIANVIAFLRGKLLDNDAEYVDPKDMLAELRDGDADSGALALGCTVVPAVLSEAL